jgi:hypothetical protein
MSIEATRDVVTDVRASEFNDELLEQLATRPPAPVVITEQEVMLGTAAAVSLRRTPITHRMMDALRVVGAAFGPPPPQPHYARRAAYIERAAMAREMDRL